MKNIEGHEWPMLETIDYRTIRERLHKMFGSLEIDDEFTGNIWNRSTKLSTDSTQ